MIEQATGYRGKVLKLNQEYIAPNNYYWQKGQRND
jgi:hypothetical protein